MPVDQPVRVGICARQNQDSRPYKILMNISGDTREFAITPQELRSAASAVAASVADAGPADYVIGFAPGGIPIAVGVAYELDVPAVIAYKTRLAQPHELTWLEPHCFTNTFYIYGLTAGLSVLLVDDEVDSGNTIANAARALRDADITVIAAAAAVEVHHDGRSFGRERLLAEGLELRALTTIDVGPRRP